MRVVVEFTKDFANKKVGEVFTYPSALASRLIRHDKVAKIYEDKPKRKRRALLTVRRALLTVKSPPPMNLAVFFPES